MDKAIAFEWADMLESGEYPQCVGQLERVNPDTGETVGYCCLGVLDMLAIKRGIIERQFYASETKTDEYGDTYTTQAYALHDGESGVPTGKVREWAGMKSINPEFTDVPLKDSGSVMDVTATGLNDDYGYTFPEIAKLIREQHENL